MYRITAFTHYLPYKDIVRNHHTDTTHCDIPETESLLDYSYMENNMESRRIHKDIDHNVDLDIHQCTDIVQ